MSDYAQDLLNPQWSQQWPGTEPALLPTRLVTYASINGTCYQKHRPYAAYHGVYRLQLVHPSDNEALWYLDFRQPHLLVCQFCTWVMGEERDALLWEMTQRYATAEAPAFRWGGEED